MVSNFGGRLGAGKIRLDVRPSQDTKMSSSGCLTLNWREQIRVLERKVKLKRLALASNTGLQFWPFHEVFVFFREISNIKYIMMKNARARYAKRAHESLFLLITYSDL